MRTITILSAIELAEPQTSPLPEQNQLSTLSERFLAEIPRGLFDSDSLVRQPHKKTSNFLFKYVHPLVPFGFYIPEPNLYPS